MHAKVKGFWNINPKAYWNALEVAFKEGKGYKGFRGVTHSFDKTKLEKRLRQRKIKKALSKNNKARPR